MNLLCLEFEFVIRLFLIDVSVFLNFELFMSALDAVLIIFRI